MSYPKTVKDRRLIMAFSEKRRIRTGDRDCLIPRLKGQETGNALFRGGRRRQRLSYPEIETDGSKRMAYSGKQRTRERECLIPRL
jgi:hypothetical protein